MKQIGRNQPCWCGSQKKYKLCHLKLDQEESLAKPIISIYSAEREIEGIGFQYFSKKNNTNAREIY